MWDPIRYKKMFKISLNLSLGLFNRTESWFIDRMACVASDDQTVQNVLEAKGI